MNQERWEQLDRIFAEARQVPAGERAKFVARACGADAALHAEAMSLVTADNASGKFMTLPALERLAQLFAANGSNLEPGRRIGAYTVLRQLGVGGAGEVWRARDERLGRDVAIKVLLPHLSTDTETLHRFAEEARAAGTLNHPNILIVHDVGEHDGMPFLVSECLEGRNLRERLNASPIPIGEAVTVALGVAHGLAAAHERSIVHRDLKPENTFLKTDGSVKLLDFGLAKLNLPAVDPQVGTNNTVAGNIAGTAGYMSPEQIRGEPADPRSDLFALGVMMYEMLGGQHPFRGVSDFETLHALLINAPPDLLTVNEHVPLPLVRIVMRLLEKSPDARFQSARDLAWSLEQWADSTPLPGFDKVRTQKLKTSPGTRWGWAVAALLVVGALLAGRWLAQEPLQVWTTPALTRFTWTAPPGVGLDSAPAVAPDGRQIAFTGKDESGVRLFVRELGSLEARAVAGADGAFQPFWSPDSKTIAYFADGQLMKVELPNGAPAVIANAPVGRGGTWFTSDTIVFAPDVILSGLSRVSAGGGAATPATLLDISLGDSSHWWPVALPDGKHFLYLVRSINDERRGIYLGRIDRPASHAVAPLFRADSGAVFVPLAGTDEGDLFYFLNGRLEARRFNMTRMTASANARTIKFTPGENTLGNPFMMSATADVLAYVESTIPSDNRLASYTMSGELLRIQEKAQNQNWPRLSPDGRLLARTRLDETSTKQDIWVEDLERGTQHPLTRAMEPDMFAVWSPDGRQLAYVTGHLPGRRGERLLSIAAADCTGIVRSWPCPTEYCEPTDWSTDGSSLLVNVLDSGNRDVWIVSLAPGGSAEPLLTAEFDEKDARFSSNGRWVAYVSEDAGRPEVSVRSVSGPPRRMVISGEGGAQPVWRRDGSVLYFVDPQGDLRSVSVRWADDGTPEFGLPDRPNVPRIGFGHWGTQYDVSPDGSRIYFLRRNEDPPPREMQVVMGWRALLDD
jgi:serine/threonine protein kinase/Tol biopolymer transport system component